MLAVPLCILPAVFKTVIVRTTFPSVKKGPPVELERDIVTPLAALKCMSEKREKEIVARRGESRATEGH